MRDLELEEPAGLVYCPARALLHLPTWADRRRTFERVAASLRPGGRFAWNAFAFDHKVAIALDGKHQARPCPAYEPLLGWRQPDRHHSRGEWDELLVVADEERVARTDRCLRSTARDARRRFRRRGLHRRQSRVRVRRAPLTRFAAGSGALPNAGTGQLADRVAGTCGFAEGSRHALSGSRSLPTLAWVPSGPGFARFQTAGRTR